jgi:misacylated tRNA(Ala) deacylase
MTEWLYMTDSYVRDFEAEVVEAGDFGVVLDRSAFYPRGGGQPSDHGRLVESTGREHKVEDLKRDGEKVWHVLPGEDRPAVGETLRGEIDWDRRHLLMRTHTALHILSGVIFRDWGASVTGGNMEPGRGRLDFELEAFSKEDLPDLAEKLNAEVAADRPIVVKILPREEAFRIPDLIRTKVNLIPEHVREIRTVDIVGLDLQADGGTHVGSTAEVGRIEVVGYKSKGRDNKRVQIELA